MFSGILTFKDTRGPAGAAQQEQCIQKERPTHAAAMDMETALTHPSHHAFLDFIALDRARSLAGFKSKNQNALGGHPWKR